MAKHNQAGWRMGRPSAHKVRWCMLKHCIMLAAAVVLLLRCLMPAVVGPHMPPNVQACLCKVQVGTTLAWWLPQALGWEVSRTMGG